MNMPWFTAVYFAWLGFYSAMVLFSTMLGKRRHGYLYKRNCSSMRKWMASTATLSLFLWAVVSHLKYYEQNNELNLVKEQLAAEQSSFCVYVVADDSDGSGVIEIRGCTISYDNAFVDPVEVESNEVTLPVEGRE